ncbi:ABC-2 type transport system ATP-binding protein [Microbacterium sp. AK009]|uniref:ABC transporter ATP-binding protein n=1 Tax=Microbacterium sp. AK009 TaxID=2723068 RepID=UPI0017D2459D|nr:ATP-binding cassette domain-containing protein [Microbacterium sp. AK009]NYF17275.1 ABC-2 type transport system ATP-binding protein [Microbacterium sp. AK009]
MTPSLPMPDDADTARADSDDHGVVAREVEIKLVPPLAPSSPKDDTDAGPPAEVSDAAIAKKAAPRAPRAPRKTTARKSPARKTPTSPRQEQESPRGVQAGPSVAEPASDPGASAASAVVIPPIPPLPSVSDDAIVIPPRPPLPPPPVTVPAQDAEDQQAPVEEAPVGDAPVEEAPVGDARVEEAPVEEAPVGDAPVEEAPVEEVPLEAAPVEDAPVDAALPPDGDVDTAPADDADAPPLSLTLADSLDLPEPDVDHAALTVRGVSKSFGGTRAVDGIDLTIPAGTFYGLVGPNGAGKTTTLSMIAGLLRPDRGTIRVGDVDAGAKPLEAKKLMGVLPDRLRTFDRLTGRQLLYYYGVLRGLPSSVVEARSADLARAFDLSDALHRVVSDYSAGMVKKIMLAGALIHSPRLLVLDEPFESVDPVSSAVILDILSAYVSHGGTVILSSHGMEFVERVCSRVAVIVAGQVLAEGTIDEVRGELTLEQRFIELAGGLSDVEGLEWLHTFSD